MEHGGRSSPAILYMLGIISSRPWDAVNVVVTRWQPGSRARCRPRPLGLHLNNFHLLPKMFFWCRRDHWSTWSAMGLDGGDGVMPATLVNERLT